MAYGNGLAPTGPRRVDEEGGRGEGATGHTQDARQFAASGLGCLTYDWCSPKAIIGDHSGRVRVDHRNQRPGHAGGRPPGLTDTELRGHFVLWAMRSAPALVGSDVCSVSAAVLSLFKHAAPRSTRAAVRDVCSATA
jgi:hypothetical protein